MKGLINTLLTLTLTYFVASCGQDKSQESDTEKLIGEFLVESQNFISTAELTIASRICEAFRSKRSNFLLYNRVSKEYRFKEESQTCVGEKDINDRTMKLGQDTGDGAFLYLPAVVGESNFMVQTHEHGHLATICEKVLKGEQSISPTFKVSGDLYEIKLQKSVDDTFSVSIAAPLEDATYKIYKKIIFEIDTASNSNNIKYGIVHKSYSETICEGDGKKIETRTFLSAEN